MQVFGQFCKWWLLDYIMKILLSHWQIMQTLLKICIKLRLVIQTFLQIKFTGLYYEGIMTILYSELPPKCWKSLTNCTVFRQSYKWWLLDFIIKILWRYNCPNYGHTVKNLQQTAPSHSAIFTIEGYLILFLMLYNHIIVQITPHGCKSAINRPLFRQF